ncbi:MAG: DNA translocase FtsK 4TM domain-containing protein [Oligoflexia bacterium]|nr:DNA translocase FtsK 4TM domain-containing protein [Oligoflexia bacterium]
MARIFEKFKKDILGIIWGAAALITTLSLLSYNPKDPSFTSFAKMGSKIANWCGYFGGFLSDSLYTVLGVSAWFSVILFTKLSVDNFKGKSVKMNVNKFLWVIFSFSIISSLLGIYFPQTKIYDGQIAVAGAVGLIISKGLISIFNPIGVGIILWATLIVLVVFYTEKSITELAPFVKTAWLRIIAAFKAPQKQESQPLETASQREKLTPLNFIERFPLRSTRTFEIKTPVVQKNSSMKNLSPREIENWKLPHLDLLQEPQRDERKIDEKEISRNAKLVEQKLAEFDVLGQVVEVKPGPAVTMYEFKPAASVKINEITKLNDDLSLALSAESLRIIAPIPGRDVVGIETSNSSRQSIYMKDLLESQDFWSEDIKLPVALGKNVIGEPKIVDLRKLPHLLVAGTTGSGKSVFIMSLVTSLIMRHSPKTLKMIIVDPKQVDLAAFHKIPHLLMPPVKEARPAINTLKWLVKEMEKRYRSMSQFNSKSIEGFNEAISKLSENEVLTHQEKIKNFEALPQTASQTYYCKQLPYIVAVIEEFSDLMSVDRNGVEPVVVRLAQMARAAGIHIVLAMQSPRREVLTGLIKTNFPGRISFKVSSKVDSTIILDQRGAERLLSVGDMLYLAPAFLSRRGITAHF